MVDKKEKINKDISKEILELQSHINKLQLRLENLKSEYFSLKNKLLFFYKIYQEKIGKLYIELDKMKIKVAKLQLDYNSNKKNNKLISQYIRTSLFEEELKLNKIEEELFYDNIEDRFNEKNQEVLDCCVVDKIKVYYRKLASKFHPDKAENEQERNVFHNLMAEINLAYNQGDIKKLQELANSLLDEFENPLIYQVKILKKKIMSLNEEIEDLTFKIQKLKGLGIYTLYCKVNEAREYGIDLISKIESSILREIDKYKKKYEDLKNLKL
jgi:hypothetical protein